MRRDMNRFALFLAGVIVLASIVSSSCENCAVREARKKDDAVTAVGRAAERPASQPAGQPTSWLGAKPDTEPAVRPDPEPPTRKVSLPYAAKDVKVGDTAVVRGPFTLEVISDQESGETETCQIDREAEMKVAALKGTRILVDYELLDPDDESCGRCPRSSYGLMTSDEFAKRVKTKILSDKADQEKREFIKRLLRQAKPPR